AADASDNRDRITARIGTIDESAVLRDDFTEVTLLETDVHTGIFVSPSQLLTTVRMEPRSPTPCLPPACEDDDFPAHSGEPGNPMVIEDTAGDRTHEATINDKVRVVYRATGIPADQTWNMPVCSRSPEGRRKVLLQFIVFNEPYLDVTTTMTEIRIRRS